MVEAIGEEGYYALEDCAREGQCHFVEAQADWLRQRQAGRQSGWWVCEEMKWLIWLKRALLQKHLVSESCHFSGGPVTPYD